MGRTSSSRTLTCLINQWSVFLQSQWSPGKLQNVQLGFPVSRILSHERPDEVHGVVRWSSSKGCDIDFFPDRKVETVHANQFNGPRPGATAVLDDESPAGRCRQVELAKWSSSPSCLILTKGFPPDSSGLGIGKYLAPRLYNYDVTCCIWRQR